MRDHHNQSTQETPVDLRESPDITKSLFEKAPGRPPEMESLGQLPPNFVHDFNNLLAVIHGYARLILNDTGSTPGIAKPLTEIIKAAESALKLVGQLHLNNGRTTETVRATVTTAQPSEMASEQASGVHFNNQELVGTETILIVEKEIPLRQLMQYILQNHGYKTLAADDATEALGIWDGQKGKIDLLLTDIALSDGINGMELVKKLQSSAPILKIIFTSNVPVEKCADHPLIASNATILRKPFHTRNLLETVSQSLRQTTSA